MAKSIPRASYVIGAAPAMPDKVRTELSAQRTTRLFRNTHPDSRRARMIELDICGNMPKIRSPNVDKVNFESSMTLSV
jgi:hypothetical protein